MFYFSEENSRHFALENRLILTFTLMIVTIMGFMASGKSSVGRIVADMADYNYIDLDLYIEGQEGNTIRRIFEAHGEAYFRDLEHLYLKELVDTHKNLVLPLGGGAPCFYRNWVLIQKTTSVYLQKSKEALFHRLVTRKEKRPLIAQLSDDALKELIDTKLTSRAPFYEKANHVIHAEQSKKMTAKEIVMIINSASPHSTT